MNLFFVQSIRLVSVLFCNPYRKNRILIILSNVCIVVQQPLCFFLSYQHVIVLDRDKSFLQSLIRCKFRLRKVGFTLSKIFAVKEKYL